jgi:hypothetical protein
MSSFYTDARVRESAKKSSTKKTAGTGTGGASAKVATPTTKDSTPKLVEPAKPKEPRPVPTPYTPKYTPKQLGPSHAYKPEYMVGYSAPTLVGPGKTDVEVVYTPGGVQKVATNPIQPEGLEEYREKQEQLSAPVEPQADPDDILLRRAFGTPEQKKAREDLLRQVAAQQTPLGQTAAPAEPRGPVRPYETPALNYLPVKATYDVMRELNQPGDPGGYGPRPEPIEGEKETGVQQVSTVPYASVKVPAQRVGGGTLGPQDAPFKAVDPVEELSRLNDPAPPDYSGAEALVSPYSSGVLKKAAQKRTADVNADANVSIPVMTTHILALEQELEKPQLPQTEATLRRDLERARAILERQNAYNTALEAYAEPSS